MCELQPREWTSCTLADCFRIDSGSAPGRFRNDAADVPLLGANGPIGACTTSNFGPGYVVGRVGAAGAVTRVQTRVWASDNALILDPKSHVDSNFAHFLLISAKPWQLATITAQPLVTQSNLGALPVRLPSNDEQRAIAQVLDTLDTTIRQTEAIIAKLKLVKQGLLHDLLTRGIDANGELRPPHSEAPHLYKPSPLGWIPKEWETATLGSLATESTIGPFGSDLVASDYRDEGVPVVFVRDIKPDRFEWKSNVFLTSNKASALHAHEVRAGDVVATKMGFPPCVAAVYPSWMPNGIVTADVVRLRFESSAHRPAWISLSMNGMSVMKQVEQITAGVTRPKVTLRDVRGLSVCVPSVEEQDRILEDVAGVEFLLDAERAALQKLQLQKSGLMDDLLTGRVRVTPLLEGAVTP